MTAKKAPPARAPGKKLGRSRAGFAERRARFVDEYLRNGHNATQALLAVGGTGPNVNKTAWAMLKHPDVQRTLAEHARRVSEKTEMNTENWARELSALAFSKVGDLVDAKGSFIAPADLPPNVQAAIASFKATETRTEGQIRMVYEYKFWDKPAALGIIARHLGLFEKDNAQQKSDVRVQVVLVGDA